MKKQEWNEEQLEQLLRQLPSVEDKQTAKDIYQSINNKQQLNKKPRTWVAPLIATTASVFIFILIVPFLFDDFRSNEESAMDIASSSQEHTKADKNLIEKGEGEAKAKLAQDNQLEQSTLDKNNEQETFVTSPKKAEETITVGFTDTQAQNILPISIEANEIDDKLEQIEAINPEAYTDELGPITFELSGSEFAEEGNPEEVHIHYNGNQNLSSSAKDILYQNAIIETFRWLNYKKAKLYTNNKEGIEFGNSGTIKDLNVNKENKKAYFLYQFDKQTLKLLVPSPNSYASINVAIEAMKQGIEERNLKPTIKNNIKAIRIKENGERLEIEFSEDTGIQNNEPHIIMLESILLTAKEFGFKSVEFKGINIDKVGVMDVTKPIEVPFSPNPVEAN